MNDHQPTRRDVLRMVGAAPAVLGITVEHLDLARFRPEEGQRVVGGGDEAEARELRAQRRDDLELPAGVEVEVDLVDQNEPLHLLAEVVP